MIERCGFFIQLVFKVAFVYNHTKTAAFNRIYTMKVKTDSRKSV